MQTELVRLQILLSSEQVRLQMLLCSKLFRLLLRSVMVRLEELLLCTIRVQQDFLIYSTLLSLLPLIMQLDFL